MFDGFVIGYYELLLYGLCVCCGLYQYVFYCWLVGYCVGVLLLVCVQFECVGILNGNEFVWVDDLIEVFFLQVQGLGCVLFDDGLVMWVGFGGINNQLYCLIGKWLFDCGELMFVQVMMQGIKVWVKVNLMCVDVLFDMNLCFVFFCDMLIKEDVLYGGVDGLIGVFGVLLMLECLIVVDLLLILFGMLVFLQIMCLLMNMLMNWFVFVQDMGLVIKGGVWVDYFWGFGDDVGD